MKNLHKGDIVYQVVDNVEPYVLQKGTIIDVGTGNMCRVLWLEPETVFKGISTRVYPADIYRSPRRAVKAYLRRVEHNLTIQSHELERAAKRAPA